MRVSGGRVTFFPIPKAETLQLAGLGLGQIGHEFYLARVFVWRDFVFDEILQGFGHCLIRVEPVAENNEGFDDTSAFFVWFTDNGTFYNRLVVEKGGFDLGAGDVVAG